MRIMQVIIKNVMEEIRDSKDHGDSDSGDTQVDQIMN